MNSQNQIIKRYQSYNLPINSSEEDRSTKIKLLSFARPHMRAFHFSWFAFFMCFTTWFAFAPLMPTIKKDLGLTDQQIGNINIVSVSATVFSRLFLGYLCDKYGARITYTILMIVFSMPILFSPLINSYTGLLLIRLCLGFIGGSFVCCQYWTSCMFSKKIIGTANAITGGWGNLGGGFTFILMPLIFKLMIVFGLSESNAWKYAAMVPGIIVIFISYFLYNTTDDCPLGDYKELKRKESQENSLKEAASRPETWILALQYAGCFGVELTINNVLSLYLNEQFGLEPTTSSLIASSFGLMNIFARATGGIMSDKMSAGFGMRGRIWTLFFCLIFSGIFLILFGLQTKLGIAMPLLLLASFFIQSAEGGTFSVVPYVSPKYTGIISGIVGAGGNVGAIGWGFIFRDFEDDISFIILGFIVIGISIFSLFIKIDNHRNILFTNPIHNSTYDLKNIGGRHIDLDIIDEDRFSLDIIDEDRFKLDIIDEDKVELGIIDEEDSL